jgi:hypothetical protein
LRDELLERFISQSTVDERTVEIAIVKPGAYFYRAARTP